MDWLGTTIVFIAQHPQTSLKSHNLSLVASTVPPESPLTMVLN